MAIGTEGRNSEGPSRSGVEPDRGVQPLMIIMVLLLAALSMLFIGLSIAMIYSRVSSGEPSITPPWIFYVNAVLLLAATRFIRTGKQNYTQNRPDLLRTNLLFCLILTLLFFAGQITGWFEFFDGFDSIASSRSLAYTFALSALHLLHVVGGVPFLIAFILKLNKSIRTDVAMPSRQFLNALVLYWNFIDILWIALVAVLLITGILS